MGLSEDEKRTLIDLKLMRSKETFSEVSFLIDQGFYRTAANRLYYSCYYVVSALLLKEGYNFRTHHGIIALFSMNFVKTEIISIENGRLYRSLFELRQTCDYDEVKDICKEDVSSLLQPVENFIKTVQLLILND